MGLVAVAPPWRQYGNTENQSECMKSSEASSPDRLLGQRAGTLDDTTTKSDQMLVKPSKPVPFAPNRFYSCRVRVYLYIRSSDLGV